MDHSTRGSSNGLGGIPGQMFCPHEDSTASPEPGEAGENTLLTQFIPLRVYLYSPDAQRASGIMEGRVVGGQPELNLSEQWPARQESDRERVGHRRCEGRITDIRQFSCLLRIAEC